MKRDPKNSRRPNDGAANLAMLKRTVKKLFSYYPVLAPVTFACILFSAIVTSIPSLFVQNVIQVIEKWYVSRDWVSAKAELIPILSLLISLYVLSIIAIPGLQAAHGLYDAGLSRQAPSGDVRRHAGSSHPLLRHPPARRYHELLHQRYRHVAPARVRSHPRLHPVWRDRAGRVRHYALFQHLADAHFGARRDSDDRRHQTRRRRQRQILPAPAAGRRQNRGLYSGDDDRPEGRQGLLPRAALHRGVRQDQRCPL